LGGVAKQSTIGVRLGDEAEVCKPAEPHRCLGLIVIITPFGAEDVHSHRRHPLGVEVYMTGGRGCVYTMSAPTCCLRALSRRALGKSSPSPSPSRIEDDDIPTADIGVGLTCVPVAEINFSREIDDPGRCWWWCRVVIGGGTQLRVGGPLWKS
jgi:hypothetical protein